MGLISPWDVLPPERSAKMAKNTVEVYTANKNAEGLAWWSEWESFPNLEILWINNNNLTKIENLKANFRIKEVSFY